MLRKKGISLVASQKLRSFWCKLLHGVVLRAIVQPKAAQLLAYYKVYRVRSFCTKSCAAFGALHGVSRVITGTAHSARMGYSNRWEHQKLPLRHPCDKLYVLGPSLPEYLEESNVTHPRTPDYLRQKVS